MSLSSRILKPMCIFTADVEVANTRIFGRASPKGHRTHQYLLYQMMARSQQPFAIVLPLPVPFGTDESAVHFLNLDFWSDFFKNMAGLFALPCFKKSWFQLLLTPFMKGGAHKTLEVVEVGSYVASFVPTISDFSRLDKEFRLPPEVLQQLPALKDFRFAVFQMVAGEHRMHPMAFEFPLRDPGLLYFPAVHVHDGQVHSSAENWNPATRTTSGGTDL